VQVSSKEIIIENKLLRIGRIQEEWYEDIENPESLIKAIKDTEGKVDMFTFWQRLPNTEPRFPYYMEWESIAALPIKTYDYWLGVQVDSNTRRAVKRAAKNGVTVERSDFTEHFVNGMTNIFNETPVRQGRPFPHYGKDVETVRTGFSRYLFREDLIGAYLDKELIGFVMLAHAGEFAILGQIISMIQHRDKSPNNALIAKAVEICAEKKIPYLVYSMWGRGSLREFKRRNGFEKINLPRYYIPLTMKGRIALSLRLHRRLSELLPERVFERLINIRSRWYSFRYGNM
jgi:hypothetical protein